MEATLDSVMAEKDPKYHKAIKEYEENSKAADNIITGMELNHMQLYSKTAKKVLKVEGDIRQVDLDKFKEAKVQNEFADEYVDGAVDEMLESLGGKGEAEKAELKKKLGLSDKFNEALMMRGRYGTTREHLRQVIASEQENFSPDTFMKTYKNQFMKMFRNDIRGAAGHHLKEEHIGPIMDYVLESELKGEVKDYIDLGKAKTLLGSYKGKKLGSADFLNLHNALAAQSQGEMQLLPPHIAKDFEKRLKKKKEESLEALAEKEAA